MLIAHPTSTCDVCLERYAWDADPPESKPHVIACGHVFCQNCLTNLRVPRVCPLCRRPFHLSRAIRVHADVASDESDHVLTVDEVEARRFEERIAGLTTEEASSEDCRMAIEEALLWLESTPADAHKTLRSSVSLLHRFKILQQNLQVARDEARAALEEREHFKRNLRRAERSREQEKILQQGLDESWSSKITELTREYEKKLVEAEAHRSSIEDEFARFRATVSSQISSQAEAYAQLQREAHAQLQAQAQAQSQSQSQPSASTSYVPSAADSSILPPITRSTSIRFPTSTSYSPEPANNTYSMTYQPSHNPLPRPPEPVPLAMLPEFARGTMASRLERKERRERRNREGHSERETDRERDRDHERDRERHRARDRTSGRERDRASHRDRDRDRDRERDRDRGTDRDTSATETQERERRSRKTRHSLATSEVPKDVVGGWGLDRERGWRSSLNADDNSGVGSSHTTVTRTGNFRDGKGKESEREIRRDRNRDELETGSEQERDYVFVSRTEQEERADRAERRREKDSERERDKDRDRERERGKDRDRSSLGVGHTSSARSRGKERERERERGTGSGRDTAVRTRDRDGGREARRSSNAHSQSQAVTVPISIPLQISVSSSTSSYPVTGAAASGANLTTGAGPPGALGLVLMPSPNGAGGYEYRYATVPIAAQSSISLPSSGQGGKTPTVTAVGHGQGQSVITIAPSYSTSANSYTYTDGQGQSHYTYVPAQAQDQSRSRVGVEGDRADRSPALRRYATEPILNQTQTQGQNTTALHVPQPRRISTHIPEPEPEPSPDLVHHTEPSRAEPAARVSTNPDLSLDATIARLSLTQPQVLQDHSRAPLAASSSTSFLPVPQQELKHKASTTSTVSNTSTSISLTGSTSGERRKQLLDALFPSDAPPGSANGGRVVSDSGRRAAHPPRGVPSVDGRPSRGLSTRPQSSAYPTHHQTQPQTHEQQSSYTPSAANNSSAHIRQSTYPPSTYPSYSYYQQPLADSSTSLTSTFVDYREPTFPGGYAPADAADSWAATADAVPDGRLRTTLENERGRK